MLSSIITKDLTHLSSLDFDEKTAVKNIKKGIIVIAILSMLLAIFISDIIMIFLGLVGLMICISPSIIASFFLELKPNTVFLSIISGVLAMIIMLLTNNFTENGLINILMTSTFTLFFSHLTYKIILLKTESASE